jgi:hypothetical protein
MRAILMHETGGPHTSPGSRTFPPRPPEQARFWCERRLSE